MPQPPLRSCVAPGCPALVRSGRCDAHRRVQERFRGSSASRGYNAHWQAFRRQFRAMLIAHDIPPVCGAALPDGPPSTVSRCHAAGRLNAADLHLDHWPPLRDDERANRRAVCDPRRVRFLCASCHNALTRAQQQTAEV